MTLASTGIGAAVSMPVRRMPCTAGLDSIAGVVMGASWGLHTCITSTGIGAVVGMLLEGMLSTEGLESIADVVVGASG